MKGQGGIAGCRRCDDEAVCDISEQAHEAPASGSGSGKGFFDRSSEAETRGKAKLGSLGKMLNKNAGCTRSTGPCRT